MLHILVYLINMSQQVKISTFCSLQSLTNKNPEISKLGIKDSIHFAYKDLNEIVFKEAKKNEVKTFNKNIADKIIS